MGIMACVGNDDVAAMRFPLGPVRCEERNCPETDNIIVAAVGEEEGVRYAIAGFMAAGTHEGGPEAEAVVACDDPADDLTGPAGFSLQPRSRRGKFSDHEVRASAKKPGDNAVPEFENIGFFPGQTEGTDPGQGEDAAGIAEGKFLADHSAHGVTNENNFFAIEVVEDSRQIAGGKVQRKLVAIRPGQSVAANIPDKDAKVPGKEGDLVFKDPVVHHDPMSKNDQRPVNRPGQPVMKGAAFVMEDIFFHRLIEHMAQLGFFSTEIPAVLGVGRNF
jgi:hypothetical protein